MAKLHIILLLQVSLLLLFSTTICHTASHNIIESIPGFPGKLPFYLETGYVGIGGNERVQMFYYFVKSERNPERDPLMLWLTGGPGCSALSGLVLEIGPLMFNTSACNWHSKAPTFQLNPHSWTKVASIIFLDSPIGTGFSYSINSKDYYMDDITSSKYNFQFLRKWLMEHAGFHKNPLYISGDSYNGKIVPIIVQEIFNGNKVGLQPTMNLQGYVLGNPFTRKQDDYTSRYAYAHRVSLLSDELYKSTIISCNNTYEDVEMDNVKCLRNREAVSYNLNGLNEVHVLMPKCISDQTWCQGSIYHLLESWANDAQVQATLHIRKGTTSHWIRCNRTLPYTKNVESTVWYHLNFTKQESIRALIYSGDQDMKVSYLGTLEWIRELNVPIAEDWRPWFVNDQVAGYTTMFSNHNYQLTYATVKGAGHTAPEYKRRECFFMITNWLSMQPL